MISREDRILAIDLINEAVISGATEFKACEVLGISQRTLFRWRSAVTPYEDQRPHANRPEPKNKLTTEEKSLIIETVNRPEFRNLPPSQIVPTLADQGVYIASESSMYRVLKEYNMHHHRGFKNHLLREKYQRITQMDQTRYGCGISRICQLLLRVPIIIYT